MYFEEEVFTFKDSIVFLEQEIENSDFKIDSFSSYKNFQRSHNKILDLVWSNRDLCSDTLELIECFFLSTCHMFFLTQFLYLK